MSLVKIGVLGQVTLYVGFYACFALILCLVMICVMMDKGNTWQYFSYVTPKRVNGLCKVCHALGAKGGECQRCGARIKPMDMNGMLQRSWAYLLTAFLLYMPANFLPMMVTVARGQSESSTILGGVSLLWDMHSYGIALIILVASLVIPLAKMGILCTLYYQAGKKQKRPRWLIQKQTFWFHMTHVIGRWSFIDVFVVALLVALVQLNQVATILPGNAVVPFTAVVILTMLSAQAFDTRVLWLHEKGRYKPVRNDPVCSL